MRGWTWFCLGGIVCVGVMTLGLFYGASQRPPVPLVAPTPIVLIATPTHAQINAAIKAAFVSGVATARARLGDTPLPGTTTP